VRLIGHFDHSRAQSQACPRRQIFLAHIHVNKQLITSQRPSPFLARNQGDHSRIHDVELHVGMRRPVRCPGTGANFPTVPDKTFDQVQRSFF
jgi:hypothetical protein